MNKYTIKHNSNLVSFSRVLHVSAYSKTTATRRNITLLIKMKFSAAVKSSSLYIISRTDVSSSTSRSNLRVRHLRLFLVMACESAETRSRLGNKRFSKKYSCDWPPIVRLLTHHNGTSHPKDVSIMLNQCSMCKGYKKHATSSPQSSTNNTKYYQH